MLTMKTVGRFNRRPANSPLFAAFLGGLALVGVWLPGPLQAADYWVGSSGPCTHASVGAAFAAALANGPTPDTIRIAGGSAHYPLTALVEVTNDDITVLGGYNSCGDSVREVSRPVFEWLSMKIGSETLSGTFTSILLWVWLWVAVADI